MRKVLTAGLAALTLGGSVLATSTPAAAYPHGWYGGYHHHDNSAGWAIGAGILGLAAGAAIADSYRPHYYYGGYYGGPAYYDDDYGYGYGYSTCVSHRRVWDPYLGGYITRTVRYAC